MQKTIKIGNNDIQMLSNAMIRMYYRSNFNRKLFTDLMETRVLTPFYEKVRNVNNSENEIINLSIDLSDKEIEALDNLSENALKMAWTMAYAKNKDILPFDEWIISLGEFPLYGDWIKDVLELVMSTFRGPSGQIK